MSVYSHLYNCNIYTVYISIVSLLSYFSFTECTDLELLGNILIVADQVLSESGIYFIV